ncbi:hypothetical protein T06_12218 [Trichinella sp. T6]|nr:hypothetical protein T06_12218 [Trichinella sp. T6]
MDNRSITIIKILTGAPIKHVDAKVITVYKCLIIVILLRQPNSAYFCIKFSHIYFPVTTTSTARRSAQTAVFTISARSQGQSPVTERELDKIFQLDFK